MFADIRNDKLMSVQREKENNDENRCLTQNSIENEELRGFFHEQTNEFSSIDVTKETKKRDENNRFE